MITVENRPPFCDIFSVIHISDCIITKNVADRNVVISEPTDIGISQCG